MEILYIFLTVFTLMAFLGIGIVKFSIWIDDKDFFKWHKDNLGE
jgi:hypothetical protein